MASLTKAQVLHVFDRSCNLLSAEGEILSVVAANVDPGPFSMVVEQPEHRNEPFEQVMATLDFASDVIVHASGLRIGHLEVDAATAQCWDPQLEKGLLWRHPMKSGLDQIESLMARHAPPDSLAFVHRGAEGTPFHRRIWRAWSAMGQGISDKNPEQCGEGARLAAGVGIGLTPAGDDFLLGVLVALWLAKADPDRLTNSIVDAATAQTTRLSTAWLVFAGRGEVGQAWHKLARALSMSDDRSIRVAGQNLLNEGHTSGADALSGFVAALDLINRSRDATP